MLDKITLIHRHENYSFLGEYSVISFSNLHGLFYFIIQVSFY